MVEAKVDRITGIVFEPPVTGKAHKDGSDATTGRRDAVKCYNCGGNHHTLKCTKPVKSKAAEATVITGHGAATVEGSADKEGGSRAYVVKRVAAGRTPREDDDRKVKVCNLSEDCDEGKLKDLFATQGRIERLFVMTDRDTRKCKGIAFISYMKRESALKACANLNKFGFEHMVIAVEMADGTQV